LEENMRKGQRARQSRDPEQTRQRILDAAEVIFAERGYAGARVQAIVDAARFGELADAAIEAGKKALEECGPVDALAALIGAYFDALDRRPRYAKLVMWEAASDWTVYNRVLPRVRVELGQVVVRILRAGMEQGVFSPHLDPEIIWWQILGVPYHYYFDRPRMQQFWEQDLTQPEMVERVRHELIGFIMRGVGASSSPPPTPTPEAGSRGGQVMSPRPRARRQASPAITSA
jgi:TetR/AcrR family transcriptional regulator